MWKNIDVTETWKDNPHSSLQTVCIYFLIIIIYVFLNKSQALFIEVWDVMKLKKKF